MKKVLQKGIRGLLCLCLAVALFPVVSACKKEPSGSDVPLSPGLSTIEGAPIHEEGVALRTDHYTVTEGMLAYFFYSYGLEVMEQMENVVSYDSSKNLHEQMYTETESWYDTIMNEVLARVCRILVYCEGAYAAGMAELSEEIQTSIGQTLDEMRYNAAALYSEDLTTYLRRLYGPRIGEADFEAVLQMNTLAAGYAETISVELESKITAQAALSYAATHNLSDETLSRNIVYLAISGSGTDEITANRDAAKAALLKSPTLETANSLTDYGTPGEENNLIPENTGVTAIKDWLFADGRAVGDVGAVSETEGTYVLVYIGNGISRGEVRGRMELFDADFAAWYADLVGTLSFGYNYDIIDSYDVG